MKMKLLLPTIFMLLVAHNVFSQTLDQAPISIGKKHFLFSKILNDQQEVFIHLPSGFWGMDDTLKNCPVAFVLDGESQFLPAVSAIDFLSSAPLGNDQMPRTIVVGILSRNRNFDLTPTKGMIGGDSTSLEFTGGGKAFLSFITDELTPYIDSLYATNNHRTIIGHSLGGLMVFEALLNKRTHFDNYLAIDPAMDFNNESYLMQVLDTLRNADLSEENLFIAKGYSFPNFLKLEDLATDSSEVVRITRSNNKFQAFGKAENWKINYSFPDFPNDNHFSIPYPATYQALKFFYDYYSFGEMLNYYHPTYKDKTDLVVKLKEHYLMISKKMGNEVIPMESFLNSWAHGFSQFGRNDLANDLFDYNIELYPTHPSAYNSKGFFMLNQENHKSAIELFEKSLSIKRDDFIKVNLDAIK